jgi:hypothetical protein
VPARAQSAACAVAGIVTDATGLPLPGVVVTVERTAFEAASGRRFSTAAAATVLSAVTSASSAFQHLS